MARKEKTITLHDREQELTFKIREMPATKLERWIMRAVLLLAGSGITVPDGVDMQTAGAYLKEKGLSALGSIEFEKAEPLLDEMLGCCSRVIGNHEELCTPETIDTYILDIKTLFNLRKEVFALNFGFFLKESEMLSTSQENLSSTHQ